MRRVLGLILAGLLATAASCSGSQTVATEPAERSPAATATGQSPTPPASSPSPSDPPEPLTEATVGDTIDLTGLNDGEALAVTLVKVVDPAPAENEFSRPASGKKFVTVQLRLKNTGTAVYSDSPGNGTQLIDTKGQQFTATIESSGAGPHFPGSVTIAKGDSALGFLTFEIPTTSTPAKVQFTMNSGFADHTGQWAIPTESTNS